MNNVQTAIAFVRGMNNNEIDQVVEAIKLQRTYNARSVARTLSVGDTVQFDGRRGRVTGRVEKINIKTVIVNSLGGKWRVTASALTQVA